MRWVPLAVLLGAILVAAIVYSHFAQQVEVPPSSAPVTVRPPVPPPPPTPPHPAPVRPPQPAVVPAPSPSAPAAPPTALVVGDLKPDLDPTYYEALGLDPAIFDEPDAGLVPLTREGIREAVNAKLPEIRECYEAWLQTNPTLGGKMRVAFTITEMVGRDRGMMKDIDVLDGGMGHIAMEGCVKNVFRNIRFERPARGETRVTYPLSFEHHADEQ